MKESDVSLKKEKIRYTTVSGAVVCLFIIAVILVNIVITTLGKKVNLKLDWTQSQVLNFSDITYQTLEELNVDVNVYSLIPESSGDEIAVCIEEILSKYNRLSNHIKYRVIDANKSPAFMTKYTKDASQLSSFSIIFECNDRFRIVDLSDNISYASYDGQYVDLPNAEKKFTLAILNVTSDDDIHITVLDGMHGEHIYSTEYPAYDMYTETFKNENYVIEKIDISNQDIPPNTDIVFLATPMTDYTPSEIEKLREFLNTGKTLQLCFEQYSGALTNLKTFFKDEWGINFEDGTLMEGDSSKYTNGTPYSIVPTYESSEITDPLIKSRLEMLVVLPAPITIDGKENIEKTVLSQTGDSAYVKKNPEATTFAFEDGDKKGKYVISAILSDKNSNGKINIISGGSSILGAQYPTYANMDFYQNTVSYLTDNKREISIRPKDMSQQTFLISNINMVILLAVFVLVIPLMILITGFVIWMRRRFL